MLTKNPENDKKIVKTELAFYVHMHKSDRFSRPELFRLASIDLSTQLENLSIVLMDEDNSASRSSVAEIQLPTNDEAVKVLSNDPNEKEHQVYEAYKLCINAWHEGDKTTWHLGSFTSIKEENVFVVEHLVCVDCGSDLMWVHPPTLIFRGY